MPTSKVQELMLKVDTDVLLNRSLIEWRPILTEECQVYVFGENYIAKRFDSICYKFCSKDEADEILIDNLYALLRFKYFPKLTEEIDDRIKDIISSFTRNLKTSLKKVSFDKNSDSSIISMLPDYCIAFRNGVYNFKDNKWLFKYDTYKLEGLANTIYMYDPKYVILWYLDYVFEPLPIDIESTELEEFIEIMKELTKTQRNFCFELMYNIAHDSQHNFDLNRFKHLCQILGYTCLNSFNQHFVMLIGAGQNGKNSLFDGCFTNRVIPTPAANDLESIENDRFITGSLENKAHNIFLESTTMAKTYAESKVIKALTGSMYQTIESKGIQKYSGIINCKYIFAANDQDKLKFGDTTVGFRRRINMMEIFYQWDKEKKFLSRGDYYDTTFSDSLSELKEEILNTTAYVYFAMYGIILGTKNFTSNFQFEYNDWNMKYNEIDLDLKSSIDQINLEKIVEYFRINPDSARTALYDVNKNKLCTSLLIRSYGVTDAESLISFLKKPENYNDFFSENDVYISVRLLQSLAGALYSPTKFTQNLKRAYDISGLEVMGANTPYVKCNLMNGKLKILK